MLRCHLHLTGLDQASERGLGSALGSGCLSSGPAGEGKGGEHPQGGRAAAVRTPGGWSSLGSSHCPSIAPGLLGS